MGTIAANAPVLKDGAMTKLSSNVYLHCPNISISGLSTLASQHDSPRLILICSWMGARDIHIAKYISQYQALYPVAQILLVKCEMKHFLNRANAYKEALAAQPAIRAAIDVLDPKPQLAIHMFSNGGSMMLREIYRAYQETAAPGEAIVLPVHTTIFDSAPGEYSYSRSVLVATAGMPTWMRWVLAPFLHAWLLGYMLWVLLPSADPMQMLALSHNEAKHVKELRRTYIYSEDDQLVDWKVVEKYAADAEEKGFDVRKEKFEGSAHVAHARLDGDRYWKIVKETWQGAA